MYQITAIIKWAYRVNENTPIENNKAILQSCLLSWARMNIYIHKLLEVDKWWNKVF
jgi:hypothetical protein